MAASLLIKLYKSYSGMDECLMTSNITSFMFDQVSSLLQSYSLPYEVAAHKTQN